MPCDRLEQIGLGKKNGHQAVSVNFVWLRRRRTVVTASDQRRSFRANCM